MKRHSGIISALLCCAVLLALPFTAEAVQVSPVFTVSQPASVIPGGEFTVNINVNSSSGFCAGEFTLSYDASILTPVSVTSGVQSGTYFVGNESYAAQKVYFAVLDTNLLTQQGNIAKVRFRVRDSAVIYNGALELEVKTLVGNISVGYGLNDVSSDTQDGSFEVAKVIRVPSANNPLTTETLSLKSIAGDIVLGSVSWRNLTQSAISSSFINNASVRFFARDNVRELGSNEKLTTGCKIRVYEGSSPADTLTVSVKGDINGDYSTDGFDAFIAGAVESGLLSVEDVGTAGIEAADLNSDGVVDETDFSLAEAAALLN